MKVGSLFSGYGGLDCAVEQFFDARTVWHAEVDPAMSKVLAAHWPGVPNLGDVTAVDWSAVEPVDVICGGSPCQDVSSAGRRAGMRAGTRSGLWAAMVDAIDVLRPRHVVWENVRGVTSAEADSALEPCAGCMGDTRDRGPVLRALGRVLGDLADLGYDARWCGLRAVDVGAPHGRFRIFVVATLADCGGWEWGAEADQAGWPDRGGSRAATAGPGGDVTTDAADLGHERGRRARDGRHRPADSGRVTTDADLAGLEGRRLCGCRCSGECATGSGRCDAPTDARGERLAQLPGNTPTQEARTGSRDLAADHRRERPAVDWGPYSPAIHRWERTLGRVAPAPTETAPKGGQRLSPRFVEWMMGLPDGWVTDAPGVSRNDALKGLGNGVVPQQAHEALRRLSEAREAVA